MRRQNLTSFISGLIGTSLLFTSIGFGQINNLPKQDAKVLIEKTGKTQTSKYLQNYTQYAKEGKIASLEGFEAELEKVIQVLSAPGRKNAVLIDEYATKRQFVAANLAVRLASNDAPANLRGKQIVKMDLGAILQDSKNEGEVDALVKGVLSEVERLDGDIIIITDSIAAFAKSNPLYGAQIAENLRSAVAKGRIQVLSAGTAVDYNEQVASDLQLKNRFQKVDVGGDAADDFVGDKISPDLRALMASGDAKRKVKVILQSDDIKNPQLLSILENNNVAIESRAENLNMLVVDLPISAAEAIAAAKGAKHL